MKYSIQDADLVTHEESGKLSETGIKFFDQLIERGLTHEQRIRLSDLTRIELGKIEMLVSVADFLRIKGVGLKLAVTFVNILKFKCIQEFQKFIESYPGEENLKQRLQLDFPNFSLVTIRRISNLADEVTRSRPIVVFHYKSGIDFKEYIRVEHKRDFMTMVKLSYRFIIILVIFAMLMFILSGIGIYSALNSDPQKSVMLSSYYSEYIFSVLFYYLVSTLILFTLMISALVGLTMISISFLLYKIKVFIFPMLLNTYSYQQLYLSLKLQKLSILQRKDNKWILLIFSILCIVLFIIIVTNNNIIEVNSIELTIYLFSIIIIGVVFRSLIKFYKRISRVQNFTREGFIRYRFVTLIEVIVGFIFVLLFMQVILPFSMRSVDFIQNNSIVPKSEYHLDKKIVEINQDNRIDTQKKVKLRIALNKFHHSLIQFFNMEKSFSRVMSDIELKRIITLIIFALLPIAILIFSVPYVKFFGIRQTGLFISIILIANLSENIFESQFSSLNFVYSGFMVFLSVLFFSFFISIFLDWGSNILFNKKFVCPNCGELNDKNCNYCSNCGMAISDDMRQKLMHS